MPSLNFKGKALVQNFHLLVPFHELKPVKAKSETAKASLHDNLVVHGDNLQALKSLLPYYHGKVKCIYIDPPYNTGNEAWVYNDNVSSPMMQEWLGRVVDREDLTRHDKWLCMMMPRLKLLRDFLTDDGVIFVSIDDNEVHWLRGLMDEMLGEENFVATVIWEKVYSPKSSARFFSENHDYLVAYARSKESFELHLLPRTEEANARYENPDKDPRGPWKPGDMSARNPYSKGTYSIKCPGGRVIKGPPPGNYWRVSEENLWKMDADKRVWWGSDQNQVPAIKRFLTEVKQGLVPETIWTYKEVGHTQDAKRTLLDIFGDDFEVFTTPKPVELVKRIIRLGYEFVERTFRELLKRWKGKEKVVANNLVFILEELRAQLEKERDRLAEVVFNAMLDVDEMRFMVITRDLGMNRLPRKVDVPKSAVRATRLDGSQFEMNLFDPVPADSLNSLEREVASFLDEQSQLYFWYRNIPHRGYYVQGWQRSRIYADFIFASHAGVRADARKVFVLETKGLHLKNPNTAYKKSVFDVCNRHAKKKTWNELVPAMRDKEISYEVVFQDEWEKRLNELLV